MIQYENKLAMDVQITQPNFKSYLLLDRELQGTKMGLKSAMRYIHDSFMINNDDFRFMFMQIGVKEIQHMELLAKVIHQMHGSDDRYYDESNDDTPTHELIPPLKEKKPIEDEEPAHINNDITAAVMYHLQNEHRQIEIYQEIDEIMKDPGAHLVFSYMIEGKQESIAILKGILHTLTEPNEVKDFGLDPQSHNLWSQNSGNYFDKPNPEFLNPSELDSLHHR